jgi:hypothetical protein
MNQNAAAEWNLNFTERIARVISLDMLAGDDIMIFNPGAIGRNPLRIENNLIRVAQARRQRKFIAPNTDAIGFNFLTVLPKRQLKATVLTVILMFGLPGCRLVCSMGRR